MHFPTQNCREITKMASKLDQLRDVIYEIKELWKLLPIRQWINNNPKLVIRITAVSVVLLLIVIVSLLIPQNTVKIQDYKKAWFYDLNTGGLFFARNSAVPPIKAPSGPLPNGEQAGVKAYIFSYTPEPNMSDRFIGFLETTDPAAKDNMPGSANTKSSGPKEWGKGRLIRRPGDKQWYPADSSEGQAILKEVMLPNKKGQQAIFCPPP